ncbi:MAG: hypothetical protein WA254_22330 [Candidatus Sulfotelmatobacter sp.]
MRLVMAVAFISLMLALCAWARPFYILCPIDGAQMTFDHQVGYDEHAVCWYSHWTYDENNKRVKHEDHVLCSE